MAVAGRTHTLGPDAGSLHVKTRKGGAAGKAGHDLLLEVGRWSATLETGDDGVPVAISLSADAGSFRVLEGTGGIVSLDDEDKEGIALTIAQDVLAGTAIEFRSRTITGAGDHLRVEGELELKGVRAPIAFDLEYDADGTLSGSAIVAQTGWGMKPYSALFGTLKVKDDVEVVVAAKIPTHDHERSPAHG